ncbi:MAG TPA: anti-sigma factor [Anaerolineales bacterium]|nr:anti-sigma factor [Anaerolineales bacterium]
MLRPQIWRRVGRLALGLAVLMLLALDISALQQMHQLQSQQANLVEQMDDAQVALAMLSYPDVERLSVDGESLTGSFLLDADRNISVLIVWNVPQLPKNKTYQVWLIDSHRGRVGAGIFNPMEDQAYTTQIIFSKQGFSNYVGIGVTMEPEGGSDQPTGDGVLKVDF